MAGLVAAYTDSEEDSLDDECGVQVAPLATPASRLPSASFAPPAPASVTAESEDENEFTSPDGGPSAGGLPKALPNPLPRLVELSTPQFMKVTTSGREFQKGSVFENPYAIETARQASVLEKHVSLTEQLLPPVRGRGRAGPRGGTAGGKRRVGVAPGLVPPKRAMAALDQQRAAERPWTVDSQGDSGGGASGRGGGGASGRGGGGGRGSHPGSRGGAGEGLPYNNMQPRR